MSERWTCVMMKGLTFTQKSEGNKLIITQFNNLCEKHSALVTKGNNEHHSLLFR